MFRRSSCTPRLPARTKPGKNNRTIQIQFAGASGHEKRREKNVLHGEGHAEKMQEEMSVCEDAKCWCARED